MESASPGHNDRYCNAIGTPYGGHLILRLYDKNSPLREAYEVTSAKYEFFEGAQIGGFPAVRRA